MTILYIFLWIMVITFLFHLTITLFKLTEMIDASVQQHTQPRSQEQEPTQRQIADASGENTSNPNPNLFRLNGDMIERIQSLQEDSDSEDEDRRCTICTELLQGENTTVTVTSCGHLFHSRCLDQWLETANGRNCPVCRHTLRESTTSTNRPNHQIQTIRLDGVLSGEELQSLGEILNTFLQ